MKIRVACVVCLAALAIACSANNAQRAIPPSMPTPSTPTPASVREESAPRRDDVSDVIRLTVDDERAIDTLVHGELARGRFPGCVIAIGRADGVVFLRAYGRRAIEPAPEAMTEDTVFDLASVSKAVATTTSILALADDGAIDLDASASRYLPGLDRAITVRHLLTHTSGMPPVDRLTDYGADREQSIARIARLPLTRRPGARVDYSDLGFILLGEIVAAVAREPLDRFAHRRIFEPLAMSDTGYRPPASLRARVAPTERAQRRGNVIVRGDVHDPRAFRLDGVAGNAGLFSTARDLSRFARMLLNQGTLDGTQVLRAETVAAMSRPQPIAGGARALGWDLGHATLPASAFGHGGFTGTSLWIDPRRDLFVLVLSNRVHPDGRGDVQPLVRELGRLANDLIERASPPIPSTVQTGIDVLRRDEFRVLRDHRLAVLTNDAARARDGARTIDLLARELRIEAVLTPEHGMSAAREGRVADARDERTGLPVHSLFGANRSPTDAVLGGATAIVIDLQDVGVRFYTYAATVRRVLEAAAARGLPVYLLDRPDPLGGLDPQGPVLDDDLGSFVNHHPLPIVHGMTLGELATLMNTERGIGADLHVVELEGWRRGMRWRDTGLRWVPPSPNLRTPAQVVLYPAIGLLEGTNVAVGRGTAMPFEVIGAPWIDGPRLARAIGRIEGLAFEPITFVPRQSRYRNERCPGLRFTPDGSAFDPIAAALAIASALRSEHHDRWDAEAMLPLIGDRAVHRALLEGEPIAALPTRWRDELEAFATLRRRYLRYR